MACDELNPTQVWWLKMLNWGLHPTRHPRMRPREASASDAETLLGLRRRELIDKDGNITEAGRQAVRPGGSYVAR